MCGTSHRSDSARRAHARLRRRRGAVLQSPTPVGRTLRVEARPVPAASVSRRTNPPSCTGLRPTCGDGGHAPRASRWLRVLPMADGDKHQPRRSHHRRRRPPGNPHHDGPGHTELPLPATLETFGREPLDAQVVAALHHALGETAPAPRAERAPPAGLTAREVEVLCLTPRGLPRNEIARRLGITPNTARHHLEHI